MTPRRIRRSSLTLAALALTLGLAGCSGSPDPAPSPDASAVLATAKQHFDEAATIKVDMTTTNRPTSGNAVLNASGSLNHQPAFEGSVGVVLAGLSADIPVTSVDGKVYAKLPLTTGFQEINPDDYGAPDPAKFADPAAGFSSLLTQMSGVTQGGEVRHGDEVLTTYNGTLTGTQIQPILPSAPAESTINATVGIDGDGEMAMLTVVGGFFDADGPVTYTANFDYEDQPITITAP